MARFAMFATQDPLTLTLNGILSIVSLHLATKIEEMLEKYD